MPGEVRARYLVENVGNVENVENVGNVGNVEIAENGSKEEQFGRLWISSIQ
jgi:hypothetical protein